MAFKNDRFTLKQIGKNVDKHPVRQDSDDI